MRTTSQSSQYQIPSGVNIQQLQDILNRYLNAKSVHPFEYKITTDQIIITQQPILQTLAGFKEQQKLFTIQEAYNILTKCVYASYELAQQSIFLGGYCLDDFAIQVQKKWIRIKIVANISKIFKYLTRQFSDCTAPEVQQNIITEKADFWSFGVILYYLLKTSYQIHKDIFDRYSQSCFLESLQIQNKNLVDLLTNMIEPDHNIRLGYIQFFTLDNEVRSTCQGIGHIKTVNTATLDQVLLNLNLKKIMQIGEGSFGNVFLVKNNDGDKFALKIIEVRNQIQINQASSEACFMEQNKNNNSIIQIKFMEKVRINDTIYILMCQEYAEFGDLRHFMKLYSSQLAQPQILKLFYDISQAMLMMKEQNMIHRDIKPENILLMQKDNKIIAKLADFGCDEVLLNGSSSDCHHLIGTPGYIAPEVLTQDQVSFSVDVWSFGIMLQEYTQEQNLISLCLIEDQNERAAIEKINELLSVYKDIIVQVIEVEPSVNSFTASSEYNSLSILELQSNFTFSDFAILE
ncbi:Kinase, ULK [Spironucleus salmonicida]|uniref:Kinase, ULK n=1 Tax=Spironucleus salmonicida TaxID=348837 RepID=V6LX36_9EUKA|nr:Kinase, ULK [Spironucleus salmonicida]|eukprot:EST45379.1 Kinase, ULK [Spironucleus salmonicida]